MQRNLPLWWSIVWGRGRCGMVLQHSWFWLFDCLEEPSLSSLVTLKCCFLLRAELSPGHFNTSHPGLLSHLQPPSHMPRYLGWPVVVTQNRHRCQENNDSDIYTRIGPSKGQHMLADLLPRLLLMATSSPLIALLSQGLFAVWRGSLLSLLFKAR